MQNKYIQYWKLCRIKWMKKQNLLILLREFLSLHSLIPTVWGHWPVGWNWTNSMSSLGSPALAAMAVPSPVQVWAEVHEK